MTVFEQVARRLSALYRPVYFLQIGAMDGESFDHLHPFIKSEGWQGVLVEPMPHHFAALKECYRDCPGLQFASVAIDDRIGTKTMYTILPEAVHAGGLPHWAHGVSSFSREHIAYQQRYLDAAKHPDILAYVTTVEVKTLTLAALLERYRLPALHFLQIDAEGYDFEILRQYDFARHKPDVVSVEFDNYGMEKITAMQRFLQSHGYGVAYNQQDLLGVQPHILRD